MIIRYIAPLALLAFLFAGCASKSIHEEYNKSAAYWYKEILKKVAAGNMDKADDAYTSLASEHVASPYLKEAMMILYRVHLEEEEYLMADFYLDSYIKRYATSRNIEYLKYLKIKTKFAQFKHPKRNQKLLLDTIAEANTYEEKFPHSLYNPMVDTILTKLYLTELILNRDIVSLYKRLGRKKAAEIYQQKIDASWLKETPIATENKSLFQRILP
jgi:outer membrane protein assembly factor BamD